jgi:hypothetical protein
MNVTQMIGKMIRKNNSVIMFQLHPGAGAAPPHLAALTGEMMKARQEVRTWGKETQGGVKCGPHWLAWCISSREVLGLLDQSQSLRPSEILGPTLVAFGIGRGTWRQVRGVISEQGAVE